MNKIKKPKYDESTFEDWGTPHGISPSCVDSDEVDNCLFYRMGLSKEGGHFELFREKHHTDKDVENAKNYLRKQQDVLSIKVIKELDKT
jgi:hypothetical protein